MTSDDTGGGSNVPVKLYIDDVLKLERSLINPDLYQFCGREIRIVDIMGVVVESRLVKNDYFLYKVDDGSGIIVCIHNFLGPRMSKAQEELATVQQDLEQLTDPNDMFEDLHHVLMETKKTLHSKSNPLQQGDCAHIQGFISDFHGSREIRVFEICKVLNSKYEIDRGYELKALYSKVYKCTDKEVDSHNCDNEQGLSMLYSNVYEDSEENTRPKHY